MPLLTRRRFVATLPGGILAAPFVAEAQSAKTPRVGLVLPGSPGPEYERRVDAFRQTLHDFGYVDKQNVLLEYRWANGAYDPIPGLVAELIRLPVDVLVTDGQRTAHAAKSATSTIPIVLALAGDVVETGLVASLARPGGNITGMTLMTPELAAKRLVLLKEVAPKSAQVAVIRNPRNPAGQIYWRELQAAAPKLGVKVRGVEVQGPADLERAFSAVVAGHADALFVIEDPVLIPALQVPIVVFAVGRRLPTVTGLRSLVDAGGLMSSARASRTCSGARRPSSSRSCEAPGRLSCRSSSPAAPPCTRRVARSSRSPYSTGCR